MQNWANYTNNRRASEIGRPHIKAVENPKKRTPPAIFYRAFIYGIAQHREAMCLFVVQIDACRVAPEPVLHG
jgi:hypothetical protein